MRKLKCDEPKPNQITLTLPSRSITYPYGVIVDVIVRVDGLFFPADFVNLDMLEDSKTPLLLRRSFLVICKVVINVEMGEFILRFNKEQVVFKVFEATKYKKENPQWYEVDVVEDVVEEVSPSESPLLPIDSIMVNSIEMIEKRQDK